MNRVAFRRFMVTAMAFLVAGTCSGARELLLLREQAEKKPRYQNVVINQSQIDEIVTALRPAPVIVNPTPVNVTPRLDTSNVTDKLQDLLIQTIRIRGAVERTATSTHHLVLMGHDASTDTSQENTK